MLVGERLSSALALFIIVAIDAISVPGTNPSTPGNLRSAFVELLSRYKPRVKVITVVTNNGTSDAATFLFGDLDVTVRRFSSGNPETYPFFVEHDAVVLVLQNAQQINDSLPMFRPFWNAETKFVVVAQDNLTTSQARQDVFRMLWRRRIVKVMVLLTEGDLVEGHGFAPYTKNVCNDPEPLLLLKKEPDKPAWIHPELHKDITNYHGCEVNLTYRIVELYSMPTKKASVQKEHLEGVEGRLMQTAAEKLGFTAVYRETKKMEFTEFLIDGLLGEVFFGVSDIGFGLIFGFYGRYDFMDVATPHNVDECIGWAVPKGAGSIDPKWKKLLLAEFDNSVWFFTMASFLLSFCYFGIPYLGPFDTKPNRAFFLNLYPSFLGLPLPLVDDCDFRGLALAWIWYSLIITTAYRSEMSSRLTAPNPPKDIESLQMLSVSHLRIFGPFNAKQLISMGAETELGSMYKRLLKRFEVQTNFTMPEILHRIAQKRDIGFMRFRNTFAFLSLRHRETKGRIHIVNQCVYQYYPWVILRKSSQLTEPFNKVVLALTESGILLKWKDDYVPEVDAIMEEPLRELAMEDVEVVFWILLMCLAASFAVFLLELIPYHRMTCLKRFQRFAHYIRH